MKTYKKIGLFLSIALSLATVLLIHSSKAVAAGSLTKSQLDNATYTLVKTSSSEIVINMTVGGASYEFKDKNLFDSQSNFKATDTNGPFCDGTLYGSSGSKGITLTSNNPPIASVNLDYTATDGSCQNFQKSNITLSADNGSSSTGTVQQGDACTGGTDCANGVCTKTGGDCATTNSSSVCEQNGAGWALAWMACPVLEAASGLTNLLIDMFENLLSFDVSQLGSISDPNSGAFKIHQSWALIRDIASALVVIVMLIMVFSQAASFGPFDAYTIRKMLPRLIAAVILIQISWAGVSWVIDLVNAIARGIANLMYWPFGGAGKMDLWNLLRGAHIVNGTAVAINWAALVIIGVIGAVFLFSMLGVALVAAIGLLFAVITLIFRKILIIALLIFVPLALLAWILPGTERYWKMWKDNFIKVLFMFPIAVAIIAAGRVFASISATNDSNQFLNLIFIVVGFFGPLFLLPKTFKWGGQAMQLAGNGIMRASTKVSERPKKFMDKRQEGWSAERQRQSRERYAKGEGFNITRPWRRPLDLMRSGQVDPTLWGRRRRQAMDSYVAQGVDSEESDIKAANARVQRQIDILSPDDQDNFARELAAGRRVKLSEDGTHIVKEKYREKYIDEDGIEKERQGERFAYEGSYSYDEKNRPIVSGSGKANVTERRAGLDQIARLGGEGNIKGIQDIYEQVMGSGNQEEIEMMNGFKTAQAGTLFKKLPHIYKNTHYFEPIDPSNPEAHSVHRTVEGMGAEDITALSGTGYGTLAKVLQDRIQSTALSETEKNGARQDLARLVTITNQALSNPSTSSRVPPDIARRLKDLLSVPGSPEQPNVRAIVGEDMAQSIINTVNQREGIATAPATQPTPPAQTYSPNPTGAYTYRPSTGVNTPTEGELNIPRDDNPPNNPNQ
jgi:hypothetical protein